MPENLGATTYKGNTQFNPAVYVSNAQGHKVWGYAMLTWNVDVFAPKPAQPPAPATLPKSEGQQHTPPAQ